MKTKVIIELYYVLDDKDILLTNVDTGEKKSLAELGGPDAYNDPECFDNFEQWNIVAEDEFIEKPVEVGSGYLTSVGMSIEKDTV